MKSTNKSIPLMTLLPIMFCIIGCGSHIQIGIYTATKPDYTIVLNDDSTYLYRYKFHIGEDISSGTWAQKGNCIYLTSNVSDVRKFPVSISAIDGDSNNAAFLVFRGINLMYYDWFCLMNNDSIHLVQDTMYLESKYPLQVTICAKSRDRHIIYGEKPREQNPAFYAAPRELIVMSEPIILNQRGNYTISIDSIFGDAPLYYLPLEKEMFKVSKSGIRDMKMGWVLALKKNNPID